MASSSSRFGCRGPLWTRTGAIMRAETTDHWKLTEAWHIADALPLREHGRLTIWQERLQKYPDALRDRLIAQTSRHGARRPGGRPRL